MAGRTYKDCAEELDIGEEVDAYLRGEMDVDAPEFREQLQEAQRVAMHKAYQRKLEVRARNQFLQFAKTFEYGVIKKDKKSEARAARAYLSFDDAATGRISVEQQVQATSQHFLNKLQQKIAEHDDRGLIRRVFERGAIFDDEFGENMVRELFVLNGKGRSTGDADARAVAQMFHDVAEDIRIEFNRAGGFVRKLQDWALPQKHNKMLMAGRKDEWVDFVAPRLDLQRMGISSLDEAKAILRGKDGGPGVYETIMTDGASKHDVDTLPVISAAKIANRYGEQRYLHFKDAEEWIEYQKEFGDKDYAGSMIEHVDSMSRDLGLIKAMGPNPEALFRDMVRRAQHEASMGQLDKGKPVAWDGVHNLQATWANMVGFRPANAGLAATTSAIRSGMTGAKLGGAVLSSASDVGNQAMVIAYNGTGMGSWAKSWVEQFVPGMRSQSQAQSQRYGWSLNQTMLDLVGNARYTDPEATKLARQISNATYKAGLLTAWDNGNRTAFKTGTVVALSEQPPKMANMKPRIRKMLERSGITQGDWDKIRLAKEPGNGGLINASKMPLNTYIKFIGMLNEETNKAVISPSARTRAVTNWGMAPGTPGGETARAVFQWKTFPIAYYQVRLSHMANVLSGRHGDSKGFAAMYMAVWVMQAASLGMLSVQLKELSKGRTPLPMEDEKDWGALIGAGFAQAGIGGLVYEAVYGALANGRSPQSVLMPPVFSLFDDLLMGGLLARSDGEMVAIDQGIVELLGTVGTRALGWVPGQSLWYLRAWYDQFVIGGMAAMASDSESKRRDARERRMERERDQRFWIDAPY